MGKVELGKQHSKTVSDQKHRQEPNKNGSTALHVKWLKKTMLDIL